MWESCSPITRRDLLRQGGAVLGALSFAGLSATGCRRPLTYTGAVDPGLLRQWASSLHGSVLLPGDVGYEDARQVWNLAIDRRPGFIVRCADVQDVVRAVELGRTHMLPTAVRGGGHSQAGHSTCDGGMLIDLGEMKDVRVNPAARVARAAAGARVRDLLAATSPHGLATPTGSCPDVGIAGLTLGGGENVLSAKYGMVCDNVIAAEVVTADGEVLTANRDQNPDLFWAIRGGSGNFGVVTSFSYRVHPVTTLLAGSVSIPLTRARSTLPAYDDFMRNAPDELTTFGSFAARPGEPALTIGGSYCGDPEVGAQVFERLRVALSASAVNIRSVPYEARVVLPAAPSFGTGGFLPHLRDDPATVLTELFATAPSGAMVLWNDYHGALTRVPPTETAFPLRDAGFSFAAWARWDSDSSRRSASDWVARFRAQTRPFTRGVYVNDLGNEGEARAREAYGPNYRRLAAVKARYDPTNFFHLNQNIRPRA